MAAPIHRKTTHIRAGMGIPSGFWDGDVMVTHTKYLMKGQYQRGVQPNYSEKTETVERWHKVDTKTLQADVWVFDPVNLAKPWYTRQSQTQLTNDDKQLRIRSWDCRENSNNDIVRQEDGTSQFAGFTFVAKDEVGRWYGAFTTEGAC